MRDGARQPHRFDPARSARLDDPARFDYLPPAELIALLDLAPGASLVDFGTGTGTYAIEIARARPDVRVLALDEQPAMLERLATKLAATPLDSIEPIDPSRLTELAGTIDRILALNVLHELGDPALVDVRALIGSAGRALFVDWNADIDRPVGPSRDHVYGAAAARSRLADHGFTIVAERTFRYHYAFMAQTRSELFAG